MAKQRTGVSSDEIQHERMLDATGRRALQYLRRAIKFIEGDTKYPQKRVLEELQHCVNWEFTRARNLNTMRVELRGCVNSLQERLDGYLSKLDAELISLGAVPQERVEILVKKVVEFNGVYRASFLPYRAIVEYWMFTEESGEAMELAREGYGKEQRLGLPARARAV